MITFIDTMLDRITMYRVVVYALTALLVAAGVLGALNVLPYQPILIAFSVALIFALCWLADLIFSRVFKAPSNPESTWITALILALIITPASSFLDPRFLPIAVWASAWAIASKYIIAVNKKHVFNPAAFGVAITSLALGLSANWWVGTVPMAPFVIAGGLLIVRKIRRFDLWWTFIAVFFGGIIVSTVAGGGDALHALYQSFFHAPALFFSTVMLTEPATTPPSRALRVVYGALIGFLALPDVHVGSFYLTPELALLVGNVFAYVVSPKHKILLALKEKIRLSPDVYEFVFTPERHAPFLPGQYMEWTLPHAKADSRGIRRYFTIASAPSETDMRLGVKFYAPASSFKKALLAMRPGQIIAASQLAGDFTLPRNKRKKLVFIAGGIGITPFRSMLQSLLDRREARPITILYSNKRPEDAVYRDLLERARRELGVKVVYAFTDKDSAIPPEHARRIDAELITREVPDHDKCTFYVSGPQRMVSSFKDMLRGLGVAGWRIKTDYFPGFA